MFRRTNGRPPLYLIGGLTIVVVFLSISYWNLNTQNNDVLQSLEKMQASLKIEEVKIAQSERKTSALQDELHRNEDVIKKLEEKLSSLEQVVQNCNNNLNKRENEITLLKDQADELQGKLREADIKIGDLESDNEKLIKENEMIISQKDDAITALDKRDEQIIELTRKVQQLQDNAAQQQQKEGNGDNKDLGPSKLVAQRSDFAPRGEEGDRDAGNEVGVVAAKPEAAADGEHSDAAAEDKDGAAVNVLPAPVAGGGVPAIGAQQSAVIPAPGRGRVSRSSPAPLSSSPAAALKVPAARESPSMRWPSSKGPLGSIHMNVKEPSSGILIKNAGRDNGREQSGSLNPEALGGNIHVKQAGDKVRLLRPFTSQQLKLKQSPAAGNGADTAQLHGMNQVAVGDWSPNDGLHKKEFGFAREPMGNDVPVENRVYLKNHGPLEKHSQLYYHIPKDDYAPDKNFIHLENFIPPKNNILLDNDMQLANSMPERYKSNLQLASGLRPPAFELPFEKKHFEPLQAYDHRPPVRPDDQEDLQGLEELHRIQHQQQEEYEKHQKLQRAAAGNPLPSDVIDLSLYHNRADYPELREAVSLLRGDRQGRAADTPQHLPQFSPDRLQQPKFPSFGGQDGPPHQQPNDVIPPPPDFNDNLDAAIDEGEHPGDDPLMPDQDPDGGDGAPNEDLLQDHRVHEDRVHDEALDRPVRAAGEGNKVPMLNRLSDDVGGNGVAAGDIDREQLFDAFGKDDLDKEQGFNNLGKRGDGDVEKDVVAEEFRKGPYLDRLGDAGIGDEDQKPNNDLGDKLLARVGEQKSGLKNEVGKRSPDAEIHEDGGEEGNDVGGERVDGFGNKLSKEGFVDGDGNVIEGAGKDGDPLVSNGHGQMDYRLQENIGENSLVGEEEEEEEDVAQKAADLRRVEGLGNQGNVLAEQPPIRIGV